MRLSVSNFIRLWALAPSVYKPKKQKLISNSLKYITTLPTLLSSITFGMTTTSKLGDKFLRIPKLDVSGSNWVLYKERFFWALDARAILNHVNGIADEPGDLVPLNPRRLKPCPMLRKS